MRILAVCAALAACALGAETAMFEGRPAVTLANDKLEFLILPEGTTIASVVLKSDPDQLSPLWNPARMARELGQKPQFGTVTGHFLCVDGFGPVSDEEKAAGLPGHGEAHDRLFEYQTGNEAGGTVYTFHTELPITQERVTRTMRLRAGEQVLQVDTEIESLLGFDRPIFWAEHATIGSPFLEAGVTVVDMSASRAKTRPHEPSKGDLPHRLPSGKEFTWPMAPGLDGKPIDLRAAPSPTNTGDHTTCLMDPARKAVFVTMLNPNRKLLLGYLFRPNEYAWTQNWEFYPPAGKLARGLEFSTLPFDLPRRQVIEENSMFGTKLYRWLPAKSKIGSRFLLFYTQVPEGFRKTDDVRLENGHLVIEDRGNNLKVRLSTAATL